MRSLIVAAALTFSSFALADKPITITVLHTNDLHSHIAPVNIAKLSYGGYARQASLIKKYRAMDPNTVLLSAGDTFQGTLYFNVY
jgi:5'-nucleotidase